MTSYKHESLRSGGFTLIELMVVLVILTIGLLPLALVQTRAQQDVFESGQFSDAVQVAQLEMESAKALGFGNITVDSGTVDGVYAWDRQVVNVSLGLDQITVNVNWMEKGDPQSVVITDMISFR
jgi:prepilin-type N-terminal cleavage/methylation domain-containing protein